MENKVEKLCWNNNRGTTGNRMRDKSAENFKHTPLYTWQNTYTLCISSFVVNSTKIILHVV